MSGYNDVEISQSGQKAVAVVGGSAAAGAVIGSCVFPGVGSAIGAGIGGLIGSAAVIISEVSNRKK